MKTEKDYEEFLELLNKHNVRYCVIGAFALAFHARPRYTKDMDILIEPTTDNAKRLLIALDEFGFGSLNLAVKDFIDPGKYHSTWLRTGQNRYHNIDKRFGIC